MKHQPHYVSTHLALLLVSSLAAAGCTSPDSDAALEAYALTAQEPEQETSEVHYNNRFGAHAFTSLLLATTSATQGTWNSFRVASATQGTWNSFRVVGHLRSVTRWDG